MNNVLAACLMLSAAAPWVAGCSPDSPAVSNPAAGGDGGTGSSGAGTTGAGATPGGVDPTCASTSLGVTPLQKLSTVQYQNTVRDLLTAVGAGKLVPSLSGLLEAIPEDGTSDGFRGRDTRVALEHVQGYFNVGRAVGDAIAKDSDLLRAVAGDCAAAPTLSNSCADAFVDRFVGLAYRRPLTTAERVEYTALNDGVRSSAQAIRAMVVVALSSPRFVDHLEVDGTTTAGAEDVLRLSGTEVASRLSYLFWQTMPDAELMVAANDGSLTTEAGFAAQLERVFADPRTEVTLWSFWNEWLRFEKFTGFETTRPALQALAAGESLGQPGHDHYRDMVQEVRELTELFTFQRRGTVADLLTTNVSVTKSADLSKLYGVAPWSGAGEYPTLVNRAGLLQRAALLVSNLEQTNPFHRGAFVRRYLLCDPLPQPDPNSLPPGSLDPPAPSAAQTTRQRFQAKVEGNGLCQACHAGFSDLGYVLESFDALGRYRTVEKIFDERDGKQLAELPIDTSGSVSIAGTETAVATAAELNQSLVASQKVEACMARLYFEFATRRPLKDGSSDQCAVDDLRVSLSDPAVGIRGAFERMAQYPSFFQRKVGAP